MEDLTYEEMMSLLDKWGIPYRQFADKIRMRGKVDTLGNNMFAVSKNKEGLPVIIHDYGSGGIDQHSWTIKLQTNPDTGQQSLVGIGVNPHLYKTINFGSEKVDPQKLYATIEKITLPRRVAIPGVKKNITTSKPKNNSTATTLYKRTITDANGNVIRVENVSYSPDIESQVGQTIEIPVGLNGVKLNYLNIF